MELPKELLPSEASSFIKETSNNNLQCCLDACNKGVPRSHLISFEVDGALLTELFSTDGSGTLLSRNAFESIREATVNDVGAILNLLEPFEEKGIFSKKRKRSTGTRNRTLYCH